MKILLLLPFLFALISTKYEPSKDTNKYIVLNISPQPSCNQDTSHTIANPVNQCVQIKVIESKNTWVRVISLEGIEEFTVHKTKDCSDSGEDILLLVNQCNVVNNIGYKLVRESSTELLNHNYPVGMAQFDSQICAQNTPSSIYFLQLKECWLSQRVQRIDHPYVYVEQYNNIRCLGQPRVKIVEVNKCTHGVMFLKGNRLGAWIVEIVLILGTIMVLM